MINFIRRINKWYRLYLFRQNKQETASLAFGVYKLSIFMKISTFRDKCGNFDYNRFWAVLYQEVCFEKKKLLIILKNSFKVKTKRSFFNLGNKRFWMSKIFYQLGKISIEKIPARNSTNETKYGSFVVWREWSPMVSGTISMIGILILQYALYLMFF